MFRVFKIFFNENPFQYSDEFDGISEKISDYLERNNYYQHNSLMKDLSSLANDDMFFY